MYEFIAEINKYDFYSNNKINFLEEFKTETCRPARYIHDFDIDL